MNTITNKLGRIHWRSSALQGIALILAGILLYTATKKIMDIKAFSAHLELLPNTNETVAYLITALVVLVEYALGFIILYKPHDARGYLIIVSLMLLYTGYIYYILQHAPFLPCSCQGAFKSLSWEMHYVINVIMMMMALIAWIIIRKGKRIQAIL